MPCTDRQILIFDCTEAFSPILRSDDRAAAADPALHAAGFHLLGTGRGLMLQVAHVRLADRQFVASSAIGTSSSVIWVSIRRLLSLAPRCAQGSGLSATVASINSLGLNKGASNDGETDPRWSIRCRCAGRA